MESQSAGLGNLSSSGGPLTALRAPLATAYRIQNGSGRPAGSDNDASCVINVPGPTMQ